MPTYAELAKEPAWGAEFAPPNLDAFYKQLRAFYNLGPAAIGGKGDNKHLSGYHRSRRWIVTSVYCTNRTYSTVQAGDKGGNENWLAALDATIPAQKLYDACRRLDSAVRAGRLPQVSQWFGSFDGKTVVGWSYGRPSTSDSSHLWHLHISFYRSLADANHTELYEILTGTDEGDDVTLIAQAGQSGANVKRAQDKHRQVDPTLPASYADSQYGPTTTAVQKRLVGAGDGTKYTTGDEALFNTILLQRQGSGGDWTEAQIREIAEDVAEQEIADAEVSVTLTPTE